MLVDPDDRAIDDRVLEIRVAGQALEDVLEDALQRPPAEALEDRVPVPELAMEIAPGRSGASKPQHRFEKAPVILPGAAGVADFPGKQRRDPLPLCVAQDASIQGWPPFSSLESDFAQKGNPLCTYECQQALRPSRQAWSATAPLASPPSSSTPTMRSCATRMDFSAIAP